MRVGCGGGQRAGHWSRARGAAACGKVRWHRPPSQVTLAGGRQGGKDGRATLKARAGEAALVFASSRVRCGHCQLRFFACEVRSELLGGPHRVLLRTASEVAAKPHGDHLGPQAGSPRLKNPNPGSPGGGGGVFEEGKSPSLCLFTNLTLTSLGVRIEGSSPGSGF